jgi:hypothetical protein
MTESEVLDLLKKQGIIREDGEDLRITDLSDITFIHQDTGKKYKFFINESGDLINQEIPNDEDLLSNRVIASGVDLDSWSARGFIGRLRLAEYNKANPSNRLSETQNIGLYSDRIKIGAFYAPLDTDIVHGCTRAFVELENTSDSDFCLYGCYLHYTRPTDDKQTVYHLPLTGTIKAGGTYVIAGAYYGSKKDENAYIKVDSYDQEWYEDGKLIDFTINTSSSLGNGFALTYGNEELTSTTYLWKANDSSVTIFNDAKTYPNLYDPSFIDAIYFFTGVIDSSKTGYWAKLVLGIKSNTMYKNTFELDNWDKLNGAVLTNFLKTIRCDNANLKTICVFIIRINICDSCTILCRWIAVHEYKLTNQWLKFCFCFLASQISSCSKCFTVLVRNKDCIYICNHIKINFFYSPYNINARPN